jgi:hypothetical protein
VRCASPCIAAGAALLLLLLLLLLMLLPAASSNPAQSNSAREARCRRTCFPTPGEGLATLDGALERSGSKPGVMKEPGALQPGSLPPPGEQLVSQEPSSLKRRWEPLPSQSRAHHGAVPVRALEEARLEGVVEQLQQQRVRLRVEGGLRRARRRPHDREQQRQLPRRRWGSAHRRRALQRSHTPYQLRVHTAPG